MAAKGKLWKIFQTSITGYWIENSNQSIKCPSIVIRFDTRRHTLTFDIEHGPFFLKIEHTVRPPENSSPLIVQKHDLEAALNVFPRRVNRSEGG